MCTAKRIFGTLGTVTLFFLAINYFGILNIQIREHQASAAPALAGSPHAEVLASSWLNHPAEAPVADLGKIAFVRPQPETGADSNIWTMDTDGLNQTQLTTFNGDDHWPAISPTGNKIAYVSYRDNRQTLWVMNNDGAAPTQFAVNGNSQRPVWSPDGSQIAYTNDAEDWWEIWVVNANGANPHRLTSHGPAAGHPSWSPDGQRIVYAVRPSIEESDLYTVTSQGAEQTLLVSTASGYATHAPAWSPDGTQIAVIRWPAGNRGPYDLWLLNADSSDGRSIVQGIDAPEYNRLSWSTDGNWIVFGKNGQIWKVRRDGTQLTQLTTDGGWEPWIGGGSSPCAAQAGGADIMLLVDRSGSMASNNKLDDAKVAVTTFLSSTNAPPDQVGLVSFSTVATLDQPLTTDKAAVFTATQMLTATGTTRIDLALLQARLELTGTDHIITHTRVIILLTDGLQNPAGDDPVLAEANAAKAAGMFIFTIGLGPDVDASLLQQVATDSSYYYFAPTGVQLASIYQQISAIITCRDIGGQVYVDQNRDKQYTPGVDSALPGIIINLAGQSTRQAMSQADGSYLFASNPLGTYTVTLNSANIPWEYTPISPTSYIINLSAADILDNYFGFQPPWKVFLPMVARNYCSGPIVDGFSDPASRWPSTDTSSWIYGYSNGEYRMYAKKSAFAGVSRGDRASGQFAVEIDAHRASTISGSMGVIVGLNDDWTDFYTFEVYPQDQIGAIWHFQNGQWYLVNYNLSGAIQAGLGVNHVRVEASTASGYNAYFYINGAYITSIALPYGSTTARRVGLTATASGANFDAHFDNFKLVPEGCPETYANVIQGTGNTPPALFETVRGIDLDKK